MREWRTDKTAGGILHVLHPADSCKDRLAAFFHWNDRAGLNQALAVHAAEEEQIDLEKIEAWAMREGAAERYAEFVRRIERAR